MDVLWAPWRMEYILSTQEDGSCIFCAGPDRDHDEERLILFVGHLSMVIMNRYPYNNGHLLVAPIRHVSGLEALSEEENLDLMRMLRQSVEVLKETMRPEGFNAGLNLGRVAGAGVEAHLHFHLVPRWGGDTNYMTVLGDVRVIPEHIQATYRKLLGPFEKLKHMERR
jgi:ATP adenylyltransferase